MVTKEKPEAPSRNCGLCAYCQFLSGQSNLRGLCVACHRDPAIRSRFPKRGRSPQSRSREDLVGKPDVEDRAWYVFGRGPVREALLGSYDWREEAERLAALFASCLEEYATVTVECGEGEDFQPPVLTLTCLEWLKRGGACRD